MKIPLGSSGSFFTRLKYGPVPQPGRDWLVLLGLWAILFAAAVAYGLWLFSRVTTGAALDDMQMVVEPKVADTAPAVTVFAERDAVRERYLGEYRFVDPSR